MLIKGLHKTSLLDYPDKVATTVFTGGCNFRCPYCHNADLVLNVNKIKSYSEKEVLEHLEKRKHVLDGICITGGEPTLQDDLIDFIKKVQEIGLAIKLDTNGYNPKVLKELIDKGLIHYVAMDIKNSKEKYVMTTGIDIDVKKITESINILICSNIEYEFRTTVTQELHTANDFEGIGKWLNGAKKYYLQQFVYSNKQIEQGFSPYSPQKLTEFQNIMEKHVEKVIIRGV